MYMCPLSHRQPENRKPLAYSIKSNSKISCETNKLLQYRLELPHKTLEDAGMDGIDEKDTVISQCNKVAISVRNNLQANIDCCDNTVTVTTNLIATAVTTTTQFP